MKAFPSEKNHTTKEGMDLRDYFAAKAMQALIPVTLKAIADELVDAKDVVGSAYNWADLMMKAREQ